MICEVIPPLINFDLDFIECGSRRIVFTHRIPHPHEHVRVGQLRAIDLFDNGMPVIMPLSLDWLDTVNWLEDWITTPGMQP
jgi:hypothetical protein